MKQAQDVRPAWVRAKLEKYAACTLRLLHELTDVRGLEIDEDGQEVVRLGIMPKSAVTHAQGLLFIFRRKAGALLSLTHERGLLFARVERHDGGVTFAGPLFMKGRQLGAGFTAGWLDMRVCWAVEEQADVQHLVQPRCMGGVNASFLIDMNGTRVRALRTITGSDIRPSLVAHGGVVARYYRLEGCMVDLSVRGGSFRPDVALNRAVYPAAATFEAVLEGEEAPPPEFQPVLQLLKELAAAGAPVSSFARGSSGVRLSAIHSGLGGGASSPPLLSARGSALRLASRSVQEGSTLGLAAAVPRLASRSVQEGLGTAGGALPRAASRGRSRSPHWEQAGEGHSPPGRVARLPSRSVQEGGSASCSMTSLISHTGRHSPARSAHRLASRSRSPSPTPQSPFEVGEGHSPAGSTLFPGIARRSPLGGVQRQPSSRSMHGEHSPRHSPGHSPLGSARHLPSLAALQEGTGQPGGVARLPCRSTHGERVHWQLDEEGSEGFSQEGPAAVPPAVP